MPLSLLDLQPNWVFSNKTKKIFSKNPLKSSGFRKLTLILLHPPNPEMLHRITVLFEKAEAMPLSMFLATFKPRGRFVM